MWKRQKEINVLKFFHYIFFLFKESSTEELLMRLTFTSQLASVKQHNHIWIMFSSLPNNPNEALCHYASLKNTHNLIVPYMEVCLPPGLSKALGGHSKTKSEQMLALTGAVFSSIKLLRSKSLNSFHDKKKIARICQNSLSAFLKYSLSSNNIQWYYVTNIVELNVS